MKKVICIVVSIILMLSGCGTDGVKKDSSEQNLIIPSEERITEEKNIEEATEEKTSETAPDIMCKFTIILPEGVLLAGKNGNGNIWKIKHSEYVPLQEFPHGNEEDLWIQAGWIEIDPAVGKDGLGYPYIHGNHRDFENYEKINEGYICEAIFEVYTNSEIVENDIPDEERTSRYWCLIFEDYNTGENGNMRSNWIFLNQKCFTKEEALQIAKDYIPDFEE